MRRHSSFLLALHLSSLSACFRELAAVQGDDGTPPALMLEVRDQSDALWDSENAPRTPVLFLHAPKLSVADGARRLFLLRGAPSTELIADLATGTLRSTTQMARVELRIEPCLRSADELCAAPLSPLEPATRYTLVWADARATRQFPITVSKSPAAGARLVETMPAELSTRVPTNLQRVLLRFDGYLAPQAAVVSLRDAQGAQVESSATTRSCDELGLATGDCLELLPRAPLAKSTRYLIQVEDTLFDLTGAAMSVREIAFSTGSEDDRRAPLLRPLDCARDERPVGKLCVLADERAVSVRARGDENGYLTVSSAARKVAAIGAASDFGLLLPLEAETSVELALSDLAGNVSSERITLAPALDLARVSIDEVRVDPLGPEPDQEYVELLNFGASNVSIMGFSLTNDPFAQGQAITDDVTLAPGERVLVVAPDFDPHDTSDGALPQGVRVARLARALSLRNEGSALYLRDAQSRRLSAAPALSPDKPGQCLQRVSEDARTGIQLAFRPDARFSCTPGAASTQ